MEETDCKTLFSNFDEIPDDIVCEIKGNVPTWLKGTLLRNGPGMFKIGDTSYNHWFDGMAYIQKYAIENGKMKYSAKYLKSDTYNDNMRANRIVVNEFGTSAFSDPCKNIFKKFFNFFLPDKTTDNCLVNFVKCSDKVYATTETPYLREIDINTLETGEKIDMNKYIALHTNTAHQHYDKEGNIYNIGSSFGKNATFIFTKTIPPKNKNIGEDEDNFKNTEIIGKILATNSLMPPYYHSFGYTDNYMILIDSPLRMNIKKVLGKKLTGISFRETFEWLENTNTYIHVLDKKTGKKIDIDIESEPFFVFHHANSFEIDDFIVIDLCAVEEPGLLDEFNLNELREGKILQTNDSRCAFLHRIILPTKISSTAKENDDLLINYPDKSHRCRATLTDEGKVLCRGERLCPIPFEFPQFNYNLCGKPSKYVYGAIIQRLEKDGDAIIKVDTTTKTYITWKKDKKSHLPTEPIFIPSPDGTEEDDGILMLPIITNYKSGDKPFVLFLDAKDLSEIGRSYIPVQLPMGFHAMYVPK
ncbi:Carotenoid isomerooxygenase [Strongyloides ratti]|uniref:Carotenoid isomerooxygenase n=1 Tax=Strongyloides ratti TaxID=34506 RepID=A0A090LJC2_STRRB|nr:Carotenoid isomerooxygenase [Strongyloides ratti]CEF69937.1 Carotenoid isomerooxygenase [Strongyloides ratti]